MMQLTLNDEEVRIMREVLESYLPELKMEAARTDLPARELLHDLMERRELCERLLSDLNPAAKPTNASSLPPLPPRLPTTAMPR